MRETAMFSMCSASHVVGMVSNGSHGRMSALSSYIISSNLSLGMLLSQSDRKCPMAYVNALWLYLILCLSMLGEQEMAG